MPSKRDGKSLADDLAEKAAEIVQRAVETVRAAFGRSAQAGLRPSAGPSPSP